MNRLSKLIVKQRWLIILTVVVVTVFLGMQIKHLTINSDIVDSLPDDDPVAHLYKEIGKNYGGTAVAMIVLETDNVFKKDVFEHVKQITDTLKDFEGVATVSSLTDIIDIKKTEDGIEIGKLVDEFDLPDNQSELDKLKKYILSKDLYKNSLVSDDGTATLITLTLEENANKQIIADKIQKKIKGIKLPEKIYFGGMPMMANDVSKLMRTDLSRLMPIVFFLIALILLVSFRSVKGVVLPLLTALIAVIWTLGLMVVMGYELTLISNNIPIILLAVGSAYTIHVINRINKTAISNQKQAVITALTYIIIPVLLTGVTTAIGFISFVFGAYLTTIRDFGIFSSLGTLFALFLSLFFVPAIVSILSKKKGNNKAQSFDTQIKKSDLLSKWVIKPLTNLSLKNPKFTLTVWLVTVAISIGGIFMITTSVSMQEYFKPNHPTRVSEEIMQNKFGGSQPVFVKFKGNMQNPDVLKLMIKTEDYMKKNPYISTTLSVANLIEEMNDAMGEGKKIPDTQEEIEQLWFLLDGQDVMSHIVNDDLDEGLIQSKFVSPKIEYMADFLRYMDKFIQKNSSNKCKIELSGKPSIGVTMLKSIISSQFSSIIIALIFVLIIVGFILKSFLKGIYATIPIIATMLILFGFMGYAGISLNIATVLVASVALGMGIDYSIHVISHYDHAIKNGGDIHKIIEDTLLISGRAILINVISVAAGFLVLLFSELVPLQNFGLLVALSMIVSGLGALVLLPVVLMLVNNKTSYKNKFSN